MGSLEGCRHTRHGLRRVRDLPIISVQRYLSVLGSLMRLLGALAPYLVQVPLQTPNGVRSAKLTHNEGVARGLGSRINGA
jgi:hypothetical protein